MPHYYRNFKQLSKSEVLNEVRRAKPIQQIKVARRTHEAGKPNRAASGRASSKNPKTKLRIDSLAKSAIRNPEPGRDRNDAFRFSGKSKSSASPDRSRSGLTLKGRVDASGSLRSRSNPQSSAGSKNASGPRPTIGTRQSKSFGADLTKGRDRAQGRQPVANSQSGTSPNKILAPRSSGRIAEPFQPRGSSGSVNRDRGSGRQIGGNGPILTRPDSKSRSPRSSGRAGSNLEAARSGSDTTSKLFPGLSNRSSQLGDPSRSSGATRQQTRQQTSSADLQRSRESAAKIFQQNSSRNRQVQDSARRQQEVSRSATARATQEAKSRADSARRLMESQRKRFVPTPSTATRNSNSPSSLFKRSTTQKVTPQRTVSPRTVLPRTTSQKSTSQRAVPQRNTSQRSTFQSPRLQKSSSQSSTSQRSSSQRSSSQRSIIQRSKSQPTIQQRSRSSAGRGRGSGRSRRK